MKWAGCAEGNRTMSVGLTSAFLKDFELCGNALQSPRTWFVSTDPESVRMSGATRRAPKEPQVAAAWVTDTGIRGSPLPSGFRLPFCWEKTRVMSLRQRHGYDVVSPGF